VWRRSRWMGRSAAPGRSARPHSGPCGRGCRRSSGGSAVELHPEESRRGREDLIGPPQLADLPLQDLQPRTLVADQPRTETTIGLGPAHPLAQRLGRDPELGRDGADRRPLRGMLVLVLQPLTSQSLQESQNGSAPTTPDYRYASTRTSNPPSPSTRSAAPWRSRTGRARWAGPQRGADLPGRPARPSRAWWPRPAAATSASWSAAPRPEKAALQPRVRGLPLDEEVLKTWRC
jgi:hypothetical protein